MKIDELNKKSEQVEELTPEQKEAQEKFFRSVVIKRFKSTLKAVKSKMDQGITLEEIVREIEEKRSSLSSAQRNFMLGFKLDFIEKLIIDYENMRNV